MKLSVREAILQLKVGKVGRNVSSKPAHAMKKVKKHTLKSKDTKRPVLRALFHFNLIWLECTVPKAKKYGGNSSWPGTTPRLRFRWPQQNIRKDSPQFARASTGQRSLLISWPSILGMIGLPNVFQDGDGLSPQRFLEWEPLSLS